MDTKDVQVPPNPQAVQCKTGMPERTTPKSKPSATGFATLGLDEAIVAVGHVARIRRAHAGSARDDSAAARRTRPARRRPQPAPARRRRSRCRCCSASPDSAPRTGAAPRGLVLVPTRELAMQVAEAVHKYARGGRLTVLPLYGGAPMHPADPRARARRRHRRRDAGPRARPHPARHAEARRLDVLVLDEADEMLDMGFAEDLDAILEATPADTPDGALLGDDAGADSVDRRAPPEEPGARHDRAREACRRRSCRASARSPTSSRARTSRRRSSASSTWRIPTRALVFCRTRLEVDTLVETLNAHGHRAEALHGGMEQRQRDRVMGRFRDGEGRPARRHRRRGARPRHRAALARRQLRRAGVGRDVRAPHRPHRTRRPRRHGHHAGRAARAPPAARHREAATKQKIEVAPIPTVADLRARRLEITRASLRERLLAGDLDHVRVVVESLANEFDIVDIAAAAVQLAHAAAGGDGDDRGDPGGETAVASRSARRDLSGR